jgi:serine/threonine protein phosphatase 1
MIPLFRFLRDRGGATPAPEAPFTAIGDIHGRDDLLARALAQCRDPLVCVGDYVDRGPDSAGVLRRLRAQRNVLCLAGNHEEMLLAFLTDPAGRGRRWLRHGGAQTLESFGLAAPDATAQDATLTEVARGLRDAMGRDLLAWLEALPSVWRSGDVAVVHAAADPARPIDAQDRDVLRWGHRAFPGRARRDGLWVVHGHVVVDSPRVRGRVISIDTGAWATDRLTLAHISRTGVRFEEA